MFNLQGHRGARGLRPENTLPSFEAALDANVSSIEIDLHLTRDGHVLICHDARINSRICGIPPADQPLVRSLTLAQLRGYSAAGNPDPERFPHQQSSTTPVATAVARQRNIQVFGLPTLDDLFEFVAAYAGPTGRQLGKSVDQLAGAARVILDLELKRVPGRPELIGDGFDGLTPGLLEKQVLDCIWRHAALGRTVVRSFDHRSVGAIKQLEPRLRTAVLVAGTAPIAPEELAQRACASIYCPKASFLDQGQLRSLQAAGIEVLPWTVNESEDWERLLAWGVDGITTDYPDRLAALLQSRGIRFVQ